MFNSSDETSAVFFQSGDNVNFVEVDPRREEIETQLAIPSNSLGSDGILELDETNPELLSKQFLIKGRQLLKLFRFCPSCGTRISDTVRCLSLTANGKTPIVHYICTACYPFEKRFEGQEKVDSSASETQTAQVAVAEDTQHLISQQVSGDVVEQDVKCAPPVVALKQPRPEELSSIPPSK
ncbi:hypothetical protein OSTOST_14315, partial [Ostertagia ostertagi]